MKINLVSALIMVILFATLAGAQSGLGEIVGYVYDEQGAVITGATLVLSSDSLMGTRSATSSLLGVYRFINLQPGIYKLSITKDNYQKVEYTNISVRAGKTSSFNVTMKVGEFEDTITIVHDAPIIDLKSTERSINIDGDFISRMPLNPNREWSQVWGLIPGVQFTGVHRSGDPGSIRLIEVHGADLRQNMAKVDGVNVNSVRGNLFAVSFSTETIEDVQVVTSGFDAGIDNAAGGYINIVTKSGGNDLSGSAVLTFQPEAWNWSNTDDGEAAKLTLYTPEASLGGPIIKDRTWFFMSYRYDNRDTKIPRTENDLKWFDFNGIPHPTWSSKFSGHRVFAKVTHALTDRQKLIFTYNYDKTTQEGFTDFATRHADSAISKFFSGGPLYVLAHDGTWKDNFTTSTRVSYRKGNTGTEPMSGRRGRVERYGQVVQLPWATYGVYGTHVTFGGAGESINSDRQLEVRFDANLYIDDFYGSHDLHFGANGIPDSEYIGGSINDREKFALEGPGPDGVYRPFRLEIDDVPSEQDVLWYTRTAGGYVQDTWTLNDRLTLSLGFRIQKDSDALEAYQQPSYNYNFGFNYALTGDQRQSLRASYGRRSDAIAGTFFNKNANYSPQGGFTIYRDINLDGIWDDVEVWPYNPPVRVTVGNYPDGVQPNFAADDFGPSTINQFQIGYTASLPRRLNFDASFIYNISSDKFQQRQINWNFGQGGQILGLNFPEWNFNLTEYGNDRWSSVHYKAVELMLSKEFSDGWQLIASYTYQDQTLKGTWSPYDPEYYFYDQSWFETNHFGNGSPHLFKVASNIILPWDVNFSLNINSDAGKYAGTRQIYRRFWDQPFRVTLPNGQRVTNPFYQMEYLAGPRSSERDRLPWLTTVNIGIGKDFRLNRYRISTTFQVFNLFNSSTHTQWNFGTNYVDAEGNYFTPVPDLPLTIYPQSPRAAQLLVRMTF